MTVKMTVEELEEEVTPIHSILQRFSDSTLLSCLNLSSSELEELPDALFQLPVQRMTSLILDYNNLEELPISINLLVNLTSFSVVGNDLCNLPDEICHLQKLEILTLNENSLKVLPSTIGNMCSLKSLSAIGNELSDIPDSFSSLEQLEEVFLDENKIHVLPVHFEKLSHLRTLELSNNYLHCLPMDIGNTKSLKILNLNCNKLKELPESFSELPNLEILDLSNNCLNELPHNEFASSNVLVKLYLENNSIKSVPSWFNNMPKLEELFLSDNAMCNEQFGDSFCSNSKSLKVLEAGGNFMESISLKFGCLHNLEALHLGSTIKELERSNFQNGNWIKYLPDSFCNLNNLVKANLNENQIAYLPEEFGNLSSLSWLDLGQNMIQYLPSTFCNLFNLEFLQLSKNKLKELPEDIGNFQKLIELRLDKNLLRNVPKSLGDIKGLRALDLFQNQLEKLPDVIFQLKKLTRLDLDQNNFKLSLAEIPKIVPGLNYPKRDPSLKNNWRGKSRVTDEKDVNIVDYVPSETGENEEEEEEDEVRWNTRALKLAMNRGMSFWRSHNNASELRPRDDQNKTIIEENDDDDWIPLSYDTSTTISEDAIRDPCEEDWDEEIALSNQYNDVKSTCDDRKSKISTVINDFQSSINRYPPSMQAYSTTAYYDSFVYKTKDLIPKTVKQYSATTSVIENDLFHIVDGQFDDVE